MDDNKKIGYMCKTDYEWHLEVDRHAVEIYTSIDSLKKHKSCFSECGIVQVSIELVKVEEKGTI